MGRLLVLLVCALAPLLASAHEGHHSAPAPETHAPVAAEANGVIRAVVAAPSRCPGGEENCCCHDAACTPAFQPAAVDARPAEPGATPACCQRVSETGSDAPRAVALARYSPRGPPARS
jgi:hypothetical protein